MLEWLVPISMFWILAAIYLGGWPVEIVGGSGVKQVIGLVDSYVLYLVVWAILRAVLGGLGGLMWSVVIPTAVASLALPAIVWAGYIVVGVRIEKSSASH